MRNGDLTDLRYLSLTQSFFHLKEETDTCPQNKLASKIFLICYIFFLNICVTKYQNFSTGFRLNFYNI